MKKQLVLTSLLLVWLCYACTPEASPEPNPEPGKFEGIHFYEGQLTIKCGSQSETVQDGTIDIDLDAGSFELFGGDDMTIDMAFDAGYQGIGTYPFSAVADPDLPPSCDDKDFNTYEWQSGKSGSVTITENTADHIKGSYEFQGYDDIEEKTKTVSGSFNMPKI